GRPARLPLGRINHGHAVVDPDAYCRPRTYCIGNAARCAEARRGRWVIHFEKAGRDRLAAVERDQGADQILGPHAGLAVHGAVPDASALWLLRLARSPGP